MKNAHGFCVVEKQNPEERIRVQNTEIKNMRHKMKMLRPLLRGRRNDEGIVVRIDY